MSIRAVRQTPYKKYNGTAPNERTDTVIPYRIAHVYVLESGLNFWPCNGLVGSFVVHTSLPHLLFIYSCSLLLPLPLSRSFSPIPLSPPPPSPSLSHSLFPPPHLLSEEVKAVPEKLQRYRASKHFLQATELVTNTVSRLEGELATIDALRSVGSTLWRV